MEIGGGVLWFGIEPMCHGFYGENKFLVMRWLDLYLYLLYLDARSVCVCVG